MDKAEIIKQLQALLITHPIRSRRAKSETSEKTVTDDSIVCTRVYKIPESDKPFSIYFAEPLGMKITERVVPKTFREQTAFITALLSKNPTYKYVQSCKVGNNPTTYWFKNTLKITVLKIKEYSDRTDITFSEGITLVLTESEINKKLK